MLASEQVSVFAAHEEKGAGHLHNTFRKQIVSSSFWRTSSAFLLTLLTEQTILSMQIGLQKGEEEVEERSLS